jgi:hypothetical protein
LVVPAPGDRETCSPERRMAIAAYDYTVLEASDTEAVRTERRRRGWCVE